MDNSLKENQFPFLISSEWRGPRILNMADGGDGGDDDSGDEEDSDGFDPETPAGKKFAKLKAEKKQLAEKQAKLQEELIKAQAKAEAAADLKEALAQIQGGGSKKEEIEEEAAKVTIHDDDKKLVQAILKEQGLDSNSLKETLQQLKSQQQTVALQNVVRDASDRLEKEFKDSIPFDRDAVIKYASEHKLGLVNPEAPIEEVLRYAHKQMNEEKFIDLAVEKKSPQRKAPDLISSGSEREEVDDSETPDDAAGFRNLAKSLGQDEV